MNKHVCYGKLTKKKQREIDQIKRGTWFGLNPDTRRPENSKAYNRKKAQGWKKDSGLALFNMLSLAMDHVGYTQEKPLISSDTWLFLHSITG